jgi:hypothetical protein
LLLQVAVAVGQTTAVVLVVVLEGFLPLQLHLIQELLTQSLLEAAVRQRLVKMHKVQMVQTQS